MKSTLPRCINKEVYGHVQFFILFFIFYHIKRIHLFLKLHVLYCANLHKYTYIKFLFMVELYIFKICQHFSFSNN